MPSGFADSFWSSDYATGLKILYDKLQQGTVENQQVIEVALLRAEAEAAYAAKLNSIPASSERAGGFGRDEGASIRKAFDGLTKEMEEAGKNHKKIADNIQQLVVEPFSKWCDAHEERIHGSQEDLQEKIRALEKQSEVVKKLRSHYFNKFRLLDDLEEETKYVQPIEENPEETSIAPTAPQIKLPESEDPEEEEPLEIGDLFYMPAEVKKIIAHMLETIPMVEYKVPILGTYQNCSTGEKITEFIQQNLNATSVSHAERIGQDLVHHGFLRLVGQVGNTFANSSKLHYQWRDNAFQLAGKAKPQPKKPERAATIADLSQVDSTAPTIGDYIGNLLSNPRPGETPGDKLRREGAEADERYKAAVRKLDLMRCNLEESIMNHLKFMERCELDRLKAIKAVILDFSGTISNAIPSLQSSVDNLLLYHETIQPLGDLRYMQDSYRIGSFVPKVVTYENYYGSADGNRDHSYVVSVAMNANAEQEQTFGVDLEIRAKADKKRVPNIVTTILTYLDHHYPDLEGDEVRRGIWLVDVPLEATHHLRYAVNTGKAIPKEILTNYEMPIIASVLKLYLLELPDSLVSNSKYEIIKTVYTTQGTEGNDTARLSVIQNTLGTLPLTNIATLDAITTHFTRLIELTSADEAYVSNLAHSLSNCILRPRQESSLTQHDRHSYRLIRDLFAHREQIFGALKRANTGARPRAISTDESQRKAHVQARNAAVMQAAKSRPSSPAPTSRHRRDASTDGNGRFPIQTPTSPPSAGTRFRPQSLEVPGASLAMATAGLDIDEASFSPSQQISDTPTATEYEGALDSPETPSSRGNVGLGKTNSLSRTSGRFPRKPGVAGNLARTAAVGKRDSYSVVGSGGDEVGQHHRGVALTDRPYDE